MGKVGVSPLGWVLKGMGNIVVTPGGRRTVQVGHWEHRLPWDGGRERDGVSIPSSSQGSSLCPSFQAENLPCVPWSYFSSPSPAHPHKLELPQETAPGNLSASRKEV